MGGGHAHVEVVRRFGLRPEPGVAVTLIARDRFTPYSGMLPGHVAGHYGFDELHIDLAQLCRACGAGLVHAEAVGLDREGRRVVLNGQPALAYDLLSLDVGITPDLAAIEGAAEHAVPVKPIGRFVERWERLRRDCLRPAGARRLAVVGGGAAGVELILSVRHRLAEEAGAAGLDAAFSFTLVSGGPLLASYGDSFRRHARAALAGRGIALCEGVVTAVSAEGLTLADGRFLPADAVLAATGAAPPPWLAGAGLALDRHGFVRVEPTLQVAGEAAIFAAGDCAALADPRPKAGVFAVRQGPVLAGNLRRRLQGKALEPYRPQRCWLTLLSTGDRNAIATREPWWALEGRLIWRWKDWIDRRWMARYRDLPEPRPPFRD